MAVGFGAIGLAIWFGFSFCADFDILSYQVIWIHADNTAIFKETITTALEMIIMLVDWESMGK